MKNLVARGISLVVVCGLGAVGAAQEVKGATVTGSVTFADTNGPARFTKVLLKSTAPQTGDNPFEDLLKDDDEPAKAGAPAKPKKTPEEEAEQKKQMAASMKVFASMSDLLSATTVGGDGMYTFTDVKPGTYYVHVMAKGYVDPLGQFSADDLASTDPAMRKRIAAVATMVTVTGADGARADLRLERGASISGRVLYDDGTPAVGWVVRTVANTPPDPDNPFAAMGLDATDMDLAHAQEASTTDDTGYYRISGLMTGEYVVQARLQTGALGGGAGGGGILGMLGLKLTVYSGNSVRRSEAKPVAVKVGESRTGYDLTLPLHAMHALGGTVRAKSDGHAVNGGTVQLAGQTADGKDDPSFHLVAQVKEDGTFRFDYVPGPAVYSLKVAGAVDQTTKPGAKKVFGAMGTDKTTTHTYGAATATARVGDGDVTDVKIDVPEAGK